MKNIHLVIASCLISIILIYTVLFIYTFFNFDKEFEYTFKTSENLNFHQKYSKKIHHIREEYALDLLFKKPEVKDLLFTTINNTEDKIAGAVFFLNGSKIILYFLNPCFDKYLRTKFK